MKYAVTDPRSSLAATMPQSSSRPKDSGKSSGYVFLEPRPLSEAISAQMRKQTTKFTKPERRLIASLVRMRYRISVHRSDLPGKPDVVLDRYNVAVFVNGCFWHGCPSHFRCPHHNGVWWSTKIAANRRRDVRKVRSLRKMGFSVVTVWEHENSEAAAERIRRIVKRRQAHGRGGGLSCL